MILGMVGLGKMGANMSRRLMRGGHRCLVYDADPEKGQALAKEGAFPCFELDELVNFLPKPRVLWVMLPAGEVTESVVDRVGAQLEAEDVLIDGGNSHFKDDVRRAKALRERGIHFVDAGTSGGVLGLEHGYCLMVGGDEAVFRRLEPIFSTLAPDAKGYLYCGPVGAGHFVKMVHNGVEYGMMQAFAEGFDILAGAASSQLAPDLRYDLNLARIAEVWRHGSVVSSLLLDLLSAALGKDPVLSSYAGVVADSGEGRWTIQAALEEAVPADVISAALFARFRSREGHTFGEKVLSAMRHEFGGHVETSGPEKEGHAKRSA